MFEQNSFYDFFIVFSTENYQKFLMHNVANTPEKKKEELYIFSMPALNVPQ